MLFEVNLKRRKQDTKKTWEQLKILIVRFNYKLAAGGVTKITVM